MDEVDRKIISQLQQNGRTTLEDLAKVAGFTSMGVRKRLQKLMEQDAIRTQALLNPASLGLLPAIVLLEMTDAKAMQDLLARFKACPRVIYIFKSLGGYNLIALVVAENQATLECIASEKCSLRSCAGIRRSEFYPIGDVYFSPFLPVRENLASRDGKVAPCTVDCESCDRYQDKKCVGCPATKYYRGSL